MRQTPAHNNSSERNSFSIKGLLRFFEHFFFFLFFLDGVCENFIHDALIATVAVALVTFILIQSENINSKIKLPNIKQLVLYILKLDTKISFMLILHEVLFENYIFLRKPGFYCCYLFSKQFY